MNLHPDPECVMTSNCEVSVLNAVKLLCPEGGPDPPINVQAHVLSSRSIELSWSEAPSRHARQTIAYSVHYYPSDGKLLCRFHFISFDAEYRLLC